MKRTRFFITFCSIILLTGCELLPTYIVNEVSIIQGYGYDLTENNELKGTFIYPVYKSGKEPPMIKSVNGIGGTSKQARADANMKTRHPLVSGQVRLFLFSKSLSEKRGIYPILDTFNRDPALGTLFQLAIVDGKTRDILTMKSEENENIPLYIHDMLVQNMDMGKIPNSEFTTFMYQYFQKGQDPYLPVLKIEKENIEISSIGIFKADRLVTEISKKYLFIFKSLIEKNEQGVQQFTLNNGEKIAIDNIRSNPKYKVNTKNGIPHFTINLTIKARIQEYSASAKTPIPELLDNIKKEIEEQLERDGLNIINKFKENDVDPLGFGAKYEAHFRGFNEKKWKDQYPNAKFDLNVKIKFTQSGIIE